LPASTLARTEQNLKGLLDFTANGGFSQLLVQ
jgi:hypothetical protein